MRELICSILAKHAGETITLSTASAMVLELFPDRSFSPEVFGVQEWEGYSLQCERLADVMPELHLQHEAHYAETEKYRAGIPMDPDYERMKEAEKAGALLQFTAREKATGALVGNMRVNISRSMHTQTLACTEDTFYLYPEHRGGFLAIKLWRFVEKAVVEIVGVQEIYFDSKLANKADMMARYLKYEPIATRFVKTFF